MPVTAMASVVAFIESEVVAFQGYSWSELGKVARADPVRH